jgi:S-formylglutathione hydrolase
MQQVEQTREFNGSLTRYQHASEVCNCTMTFSVYLPPQAEHGDVPVLYWLSGLTCTDDNFRSKAGAARYAAEAGMAIVMPDTSPRGDDVADEPDRYDLGKGAGFYVNATQSPWSSHYQMFDYVTKELPQLVEDALPLTAGQRSISGHSMGGHGAIICALKNPGTYKSVSAFAPIANPVECAWGEGCLGTYLGDDRAAWQAWDAVCLMRAGANPGPILVDQGMADNFLSDQLKPENLSAACHDAGVELKLRMQPGYDHSYHFIATFIGEHIAWHAKALIS